MLEERDAEITRLRAELLRVTELETAIEVRDEDCERLRAENEALKADADLLNWLVTQRQGWFSRLCPNPIFPGQTYKSVLYDAYKQWREKK
jgi:hypothetical protein